MQQVTHATRKDQQLLASLLEDVSNRLTYMTDFNEQLTVDDQRQVAQACMWRVLQHENYDPTKGTSLVTYLVSVGNNAIFSLFRSTKKRQFYRDCIIRNTNNALSFEDFEAIVREVQDSDTVSDDVLDIENIADHVRVLLRLVYLSEEEEDQKILGTMLQDNQVLGKKMNYARVAKKVATTEYRVKNVIRVARSRALLLYDLLHVYSFSDLFTTIHKIHTKGYKILKAGKIGVLTNLMGKNKNEAKNAECYASSCLTVARSYLGKPDVADIQDLQVVYLLMMGGRYLGRRFPICFVRCP